MAELKETIDYKKDSNSAACREQNESKDTERANLMQANINTKSMMADELMAEGVGRDSVARVLHVTTAELEDLLDKARQQPSLKQAESA